WYSPHKNSEGDIIGLIGMSVNITDKTIAEKNLYYSEERFRSMMQQSPSVIELYDIDGLQIDVNKAYEELWNFPASTTVNKFNVLKSKEVEDTGLMKYVKKAYAGEIVQVPEYKFDPTGDTEAEGLGRIRWLSTRIYPLKGQDGKVKNIVITHEDITKSKIAESALRESQQKLSLHIEQTPLGVIEWNPDFIVTDWNKAAEKIFGYSREEAVGKHPKSLILPKNILTELDNVWNDLLNNKGGYRSTNENITKDGNIIICEWYNTPLVNDEGKVIGVASLVEDITSRIEAEKELNSYKDHLEKMVEKRTDDLEKINKQLHIEIDKQKEAENAVKTSLMREQELNEMKTHFVSMVSHEFRTPLTSILASADLLEMYGRKWKTEKYNEHVFKIQNSVDQMKIMLEDVLTLSRADRGKIEFNPALINLKRICN
ncbi:MAG: PAS domain S-box protein, partial [Melioribacteraceae bacterium]|nr:PAS domain S-box protein [Melioribacteraceae bacterium]